MGLEETHRQPDYNAWVHWETWAPCNFRCAYCTSNKNPARETDIRALLRTLGATGRIFRFSFTGGGEPFLVPNLVETCRELSQGHYISIITHLTHKRVPEMLDAVPPDRLLLITASVHLEELSRLGLLETFARHYHACVDRGVPVEAVAVAYPRLLGALELHRNRLHDHGIEFTFAPYLGEYAGKLYPAAYTAAERDAFGLSDAVASRHHQQGNLCNAGYNALVASPNGDVYSCFNSRNAALGSRWFTPRRHRRLGNLFTGIHLRPDMVRCPFELCIAPLRLYDERLFSAARAACGSG